MERTAKKSNTGFIAGVLLLCVGIQFANYGTAVCISGAVSAMNALQYYVLISAFGSLGMVLILPVVGKLTEMFGMRTLILAGIVVQFLGRIVMIISSTWVPFSLGYLLQSVGGGVYISAPFVLMAISVAPQDRARYFGYIAMANAVGAIFGPIVISIMYSAGGAIAKIAYIAHLPFVVIAYLMIAGGCPKNANPAAAKGFDYLGLLLTVVGIACITLWMNLGNKMFTWLSVPSAVMLVLAVVCIVWLIRRESSIADPAVPIRMFKNSRLTYAFIGSLVSAAYATCSGSYCVMWTRYNYQNLPLTTLFNGTATMAEQIVIFILGLFLGGYVAKKFKERFRKFGILSMVAACIALIMLMCLKFTGTAAEGNVMLIGNSFPVGMLIIYAATAVGGFTSCVAQSTFSAFWQSNTPREEISAGQALYTFGSTGGSVIFAAVVGVVLGNSGDYIRAFATGLVFALIGLVCAVKGFKFDD